MTKEEYREKLKMQQDIDTKMYNKIEEKVTNIRADLELLKKLFKKAEFWRYMENWSVHGEDEDPKTQYCKEALEPIDLCLTQFAESEYAEECGVIVALLDFIWESICFSPASYSEAGWKIRYGKEEE